MHRKNWGFTANHLTVIIVAAMIAIMPGSLWAVASYQRIAIQDPQSGKKSKIDGQRRLRVYDEESAADELPGNFVRFYQHAETTCAKLATPPAGKAMVVKSASVDIYAQSNLGGAYVVLIIGSTCSGPVAVVDGDIGVTTLDLEPGLVVPAGQSLWVSRSSTSVGAFVYGAGYLVPADWAPASAAHGVSASPAGERDMARPHTGR